MVAGALAACGEDEESTGPGGKIINVFAGANSGFVPSFNPFSQNSVAGTLSLVYEALAVPSRRPRWRELLRSRKLVVAARASILVGLVVGQLATTVSVLVGVVGGTPPRGCHWSARSSSS